MKNLIRFLKEQNGTTVTEYAMISGLISLAALTAMLTLGIKLLVLYAA